MSVWPLVCFVKLDGWNMNIFILRLHMTGGSPNNVCLVASAWYNCSTRSDMRSEFGVSPRERLQAGSGKYYFISDPQAGPAGHESDPPTSSCTFAKRWISAGQIRGSDPRVSREQLAGHGNPTRD